MARDHRRLAAVVSLDVAGYSRLMGVDDSGTLAALKAHRRELIDPKIAEHEGRIVKTTGDGLLLEYPSVVDAVRCAVEMQRGMAERNVGISPDKRLDFRIGINVGDIIIDGDDIFGDGVNVAARLEALADPGGICVSRVVRDQVLDKLSFTFEDLGAQEVKNIARPVEAFRIALGGGALPARRPLLRSRPRVRRAVMGAGFAAFAAVVSTFFWWNWHRDAMPPTFAMSVAVLPFTVVGGGTDDRLAEILTSNVTTILSRDYATRVVGHGLVAGNKGEQKDFRTLGRELHVRYLATGELHHEGGKFAFLAHLIEAETGVAAWSDRFEFDANQLEGAPAQVAQRIQRRLWNGMYAAAKRYARANPTSSDPWNVYLRAADTWENGGNASAARKQMEEALRLDPDFVPALAGVANTIMAQLSEEPETDSVRIRQAKEDIDRLSGRAVVLAAGDWNAWRIRANALAWLGRWDEALAAIARAQALDSSSTKRLLDRAWILLLMGRPDEALSLARQAHAMDPEATGANDAPYFSWVECQANLMSGNYRAATSPCEQNGARGDSWRDQVLLVATYAQQGEIAKAAAAKTVALKLKPALSIARLKSMPQVGSEAYLDLLEAHYYPGLRKAAFPEQ